MNRKVVIDYDLFKDVMLNYLSDSLLSEVIDCLNDNDVFITDVRIDLECNYGDLPFSDSCIICENGNIICDTAEDCNFNQAEILEKCEYARLSIVPIK